MDGYVTNIEDLVDENDCYRRVLYSGSHLQLVLMSLKPGEEIGGETHSDTDQFFRIEEGKGRMIIDGETHKVSSGDAILVPAGAHHNLICTGHEAMKLYTIYGPPHHLDQLRQMTRAEATDAKEAFDGKTTEQPGATLLA